MASMAPLDPPMNRFLQSYKCTWNSDKSLALIKRNVSLTFNYLSH